MALPRAPNRVSIGRGQTRRRKRAIGSPFEESDAKCAYNPNDAPAALKPVVQNGRPSCGPSYAPRLAGGSAMKMSRRDAANRPNIYKISMRIAASVIAL
jgi:hypothetical protein